MVGRIGPLGWDRVKVSENLDVTPVAPVAPVFTSLCLLYSTLFANWGLLHSKPESALSLPTVWSTRGNLGATIADWAEQLISAQTRQESYVPKSLLSLQYIYIQWMWSYYTIFILWIELDLYTFKVQNEMNFIWAIILINHIIHCWDIN